MHDSVTERMTGVGRRARAHAMRARIDKLDRENERLRTEVGVLRTDLDAERGALMASLKGGTGRRGEKPERRRPHLLRTLVIAAGAYVLGTRDGRDRYDRIVGAMRSFAGSMSQRTGGDGWGITGREDAGAASA